MTKSGLGRITEGTSQYQGVVVYSMHDLPLVSILNFFFIINKIKFLKNFFIFIFNNIY